MTACVSGSCSPISGRRWIRRRSSTTSGQDRLGGGQECGEIAGRRVGHASRVRPARGGVAGRDGLDPLHGGVGARHRRDLASDVPRAAEIARVGHEGLDRGVDPGGIDAIRRQDARYASGFASIAVVGLVGGEGDDDHRRAGRERRQHRARAAVMGYEIGFGERRRHRDVSVDGAHRAGPGPGRRLRAQPDDDVCARGHRAIDQGAKHRDLRVVDRPEGDDDPRPRVASAGTLVGGQCVVAGLSVIGESAGARRSPREVAPPGLGATAAGS